MTNIADWIVKEHEEFRAMLKDLVEMYENDPEERRRAYVYFRKRLRGHGKAEEEVLFPTMMQNDQTKLAGMEAWEWHNAMRPLLKGIMETDPEKEQWLPKMRVARKVALDHLDMEEEVALGLVRRVFEPELLGLLGKDFRSVEEEYLKEEGIH